MWRRVSVINWNICAYIWYHFLSIRNQTEFNNQTDLFRIKWKYWKSIKNNIFVHCKMLYNFKFNYHADSVFFQIHFFRVQNRTFKAILPGFVSSFFWILPSFFLNWWFKWFNLKFQISFQLANTIWIFGINLDSNTDISCLGRGSHFFICFSLWDEFDYDYLRVGNKSMFTWIQRRPQISEKTEMHHERRDWEEENSLWYHPISFRGRRVECSVHWKD